MPSPPAAVMLAELLTVTSPKTALFGVVDKDGGVGCGRCAAFVGCQNSGWQRPAASRQETRIDRTRGRDGHRAGGCAAGLRDRSRLVVDIDADAAGDDGIVRRRRDRNVSGRVRERLDTVKVRAGAGAAGPGRHRDPSGPVPAYLYP